MAFLAEVGRSHHPNPHTAPLCSPPLPSLFDNCIVLPPLPIPLLAIARLLMRHSLMGPLGGGPGLRRSLKTCNLHYMDLINNERTSIHASIKRKKKRKGCSVSNFKDMQNVLHPKVTIGQYSHRLPQATSLLLSRTDQLMPRVYICMETHTVLCIKKECFTSEQKESPPNSVSIVMEKQTKNVQA